MKGFEIIINNEAPICAASDILVSIHFVVGYSREFNSLRISGLDSNSYRLTWLERELQIGDKIKIKATEIDKTSPLKEKYPIDRTELKDRYFQLKKELEDAGLI